MATIKYLINQLMIFWCYTVRSLARLFAARALSPKVDLKSHPDSFLTVIVFVSSSVVVVVAIWLFPSDFCC